MKRIGGEQVKIIEFVKLGGYLLLLALFLIVIRTYVFSPVIVKGDSMDPTLENDERVIALKFGDVARFDIVTFPAPDATNKNYIKRVIGLPGDTIAYENDVLYVNGVATEEPYLAQYKERLPEGAVLTNDFTFESLAAGYPRNDINKAFIGVTKVPEGQLFVLGDNRQISKDSRIIGFINKSDILGNVKYVFWPLERVGMIK